MIINCKIYLEIYSLFESISVKVIIFTYFVSTYFILRLFVSLVNGCYLLLFDLPYW